MIPSLGLASSSACPVYEKSAQSFLQPRPSSAFCLWHSRAARCWPSFTPAGPESITQNHHCNWLFHSAFHHSLVRSRSISFDLDKAFLVADLGIKILISNAKQMRAASCRPQAVRWWTVLVMWDDSLGRQKLMSPEHCVLVNPRTNLFSLFRSIVTLPVYK